MASSSPSPAVAATATAAESNKDDDEERILLPGKPDYDQCDNKVVTAKYTLTTFFPLAIVGQFRRFANLYFLIIGIIMAIGWFTTLYESALTPWTTLGPLMLVITVSLFVEGSSDYQRHLNDQITNNTPCVILRRSDELNTDETSQRDDSIIEGKDVQVNINKAYYHTTTTTTNNSLNPPLFNRNESANQEDAILVSVGFEKVRRMDIRQGHFVLVKNREMVPADMLLLASSNDQGSAYIETSSIDGETNLKLRNCASIPKRILQLLREGNHDEITKASMSFLSSSSNNLEHIGEEMDIRNDYNNNDNNSNNNNGTTSDFETIEDAVKRITRFSYLGRPSGKSALEHPLYGVSIDRTSGMMMDNDNGGGTRASVSLPSLRYNNRNSSLFQSRRRRASVTLGNGSIPGSTIGVDLVSESVERVRRASVAFAKSVKNIKVDLPKYAPRRLQCHDDGRYIATLTTELPNPSVHTFQGKLTLPPFEPNAGCLDIPLGAENVILRGAMIRNTQWILGVAFFTGQDTKLVRNSFETPSKFSQLDILMNYTVAAILILMMIIISILSTLSVIETERQFDDLWYVGLNTNTTERWPYQKDLPPPQWVERKQNWIQIFLLYVTLLNQFIPLSLYITVEIVTFVMLWFIQSDVDMYDTTSNTCALARSTIVTDLGRVEYIFSDKTGTLTQNVMRFRRCSVDGRAFGAPIEKQRPGVTGTTTNNDHDDDENNNLEDEQPPPPSTTKSTWLPLQQLLVNSATEPQQSSFNAEMFLRIMSLCHTVVVEKDLGNKININNELPLNKASTGPSLRGGGLFRRGKNSKLDVITGTTGSNEGASNQTTIPETVKELTESESNKDTSINDTTSNTTTTKSSSTTSTKSADGAPMGYAYQAESPDEGALVAAASLEYGYQVISRDASGITIRVSEPSIFQDATVVEGLRSGNIPLKRLAADTALNDDNEPSSAAPDRNISSSPNTNDTNQHREETWAILAVNKFDSTRKRMSILLRSPPELGSLAILFCKGADSAMLDPEVTSSTALALQSETNDDNDPTSPRVSALSTTVEKDAGDGITEQDKDDIRQDEWDVTQMLGLQSQLGDFASEGLRTLVLGLRVLTEDECEEWLAQYRAAAVSLTDREKLLTEAALAVERNLHVAGATAIEDKLQVGVPETISNLSKAGIKLWVCTGDKRETAIEIGYSTAVLTPQMTVTEVGDKGKEHVRTQMSMEFIRLVKKGKLPEYQKAVFNRDRNGTNTLEQRLALMMFWLGKCLRSFGRGLSGCWAMFLSLMGYHERAERKRQIIDERMVKEESVVMDDVRRERVRARADETIQLWLSSSEGKKYHSSGKPLSEEALITDTTPEVFNRARSARLQLDDLRMSTNVSFDDLKRISMSHRKAPLVPPSDPAEGDAMIVDEDTFSQDSFFPGDKEDLGGFFDKKRRTGLERLFAVDRQVRKGQLLKHAHPEKVSDHLQNSGNGSVFNSQSPAIDGPRALVIEGAALKHLLGDKEMEEILFSVASVCDAVIACRVSPKQKAELVNLVRQNVKPTPTTLAIGDGANDVGMIQEAHVGIGISGKEGTQAVNAADFAISQFRFLETLVLIHGRWDFFRLTTVVLYSFYKNAVQAGIMVLFNFNTVFSGQPFFDQWLIAAFNFVCGAPIIFTGLFDRCLSKQYVRAHPEVYKATRENELITVRTLTRWVTLTIIHVCTLYFFTVAPSGEGGGMTSSPLGLMRNNDDMRPGDGEGGDWRSIGTLTFTCMVILMAYKVLYESTSLVHGRWPAITCSKANDSFVNRLAYTWIGVSWLSVGFYFIYIAAYQLVGRIGASDLSPFVDMANHVLGTRSINWMIIFFVPIFATAFDVVFKVYSNMYYPTQTQVHQEIEYFEKKDLKQAIRKATIVHEDSNPQV